MKAPDKIYIEIRHPFGNEYTEFVGFENRGNSEDIEYIRKDALMEWMDKNIKQLNVLYSEIFISRVKDTLKLL